MNKFVNPDRKLWPSLMARPVLRNDQLIPVVSQILDDVRVRGDVAIQELTFKFDGSAPDKIMVSDLELNQATPLVDDELKSAIRAAASNIEAFHSAQMPRVVRTETMPGVKCWQRSVPIGKVGLYIPGGTAPLFSTVLMLSIPAHIAQCDEVILCTPPDKDGKINPAILFAAKLTGITRVYKVGGAQAIAAMAYGTDTIPKVDKIFGPGNQYVTTAKQLVSAQGIAIDMPAGPSEAMVIADKTTPAHFAAADLLSQAEHGVDSQVILIADSESKLDEIITETNRQLYLLPRKDIAEKALQNSRFICFEKQTEAVTFMNEYAPEHLILAVENPEEWAVLVKQAGSVFMGLYTPESAGDYASGTNHTLPTNGFAKAYSGVNIDSFIKKITFQQITPQGLTEIGKIIETMAMAEKLDAHKNAVSVRLNDISKNNNLK